MTIPALNLRELEAFRETLWAGSATGAASRLGVSQPAISRALAQLESRLDVVLFQRREGRLQPTADALALNDELAPVFKGLDRISHFAARDRKPEGGRLRVVAPTSFNVGFVHSEIAEFAKNHPAVTVQLETQPSDEGARRISAGEADIAIADSSARVNHEGVRLDLLAETDAACIMPSGDPLAEKSEIGPRDLEGRRFIALSRRFSSRVELDRIFEQAGVKREIAIETSTAVSACELVGAGVGVAVINPFPSVQIYWERIAFRRFVPAIPYRIFAMLLSTAGTAWPARVFAGQLKRSATAGMKILY